jgi:hypothetical protein
MAKQARKVARKTESYFYFYVFEQIACYRILLKESHRGKTKQKVQDPYTLSQINLT